MAEDHEIKMNRCPHNKKLAHMKAALEKLCAETTYQDTSDDGKVVWMKMVDIRDVRAILDGGTP